MASPPTVRAPKVSSDAVLAGARPRFDPGFAGRAIVLGVIRVYQQTLSPLLGPRCRFEPSCSRYTATCIERFGLGRGVLLGAWRLARCHPFHPGGYDPPPALHDHAPPPSM